MSALPCPVPVENPFAAADRDYATITEFLYSEEAQRLEHSDLERQLEDGPGVDAEIVAGASGPASAGPGDRTGAGCRWRPAHPYAGTNAQLGNHLRHRGRGPHRLWRRWQAQSASARRSTESPAGEVLAGTAATRGDRSIQERV